MTKLEKRILMAQKAKLIVPKIINLFAEEGVTVEEADLILSVTAGRVTTGNSKGQVMADSLTGKAKERLLVGKAIVEEFFHESSYEEIKSELNLLSNILESIFDKSSIEDRKEIDEIINFAKIYAANVKN